MLAGIDSSKMGLDKLKVENLSVAIGQKAGLPLPIFLRLGVFEQPLLVGDSWGDRYVNY